MINGMLPVRRYAGDKVMFYVKVEPAAAAAVRACGGNLFHMDDIITPCPEKKQRKEDSFGAE
jgi:hypothetical protein